MKVIFQVPFFFKEPRGILNAQCILYTFYLHLTPELPKTLVNITYIKILALFFGGKFVSFLTKSVGKFLERGS